MFILPVGSANLVIVEPTATYNNIGLKDQNDNWIIDDQTGTSIKYAAGSRITFVRGNSMSAEKLFINGPITEPLKVMFLFWYETNTGIPYTYYEPLATPDRTPLTFIWKYTLSDCSEACAGGIQIKITTCHRSDDQSEVGLEHCDSSTEPSDTEACNTQSCAPTWQADNWRSCSVECGPDGTQTRTVECRQKVSADVTNVVADDQCTDTKPDASQECNRKDCEPDWVPNDWSACSKNKCEGVQIRTLSCKKTSVSGDVQDLPDSDCPSETPPTELVCNADVLCYEWRPVYPSCSECRDYLTGEYGSQYKPVGCYKMKTRAFGPMLTKLALNNNKAETVAECGRVAWEQARRVFAVGGDGECYSSMNSHRMYHKDGKAEDCTDDLIGGAQSVYVYALTGKALLSTPTCYSVEDGAFLAQNSNCESLAPQPHPEIKVCCEDVCQDNCYKTITGSYCSIPFIYKGKTFYECTPNIDSGRMWCATTSNFDIDGLGEDCEEPCRKRTSSGDCCSFPFIYRSRLYNKCTSIDSDQPWCSLTSNYDRDHLKGKCT